MKRFLVFAGLDHYPDKGWLDFRGCFDTLDAARDDCKVMQNPPIDEEGMYEYGPCDWTQIVDSEQGCIVEET